MQAATLRTNHALPTPTPAPAPAADDWDWVYDDPDLAPFLRTTRRARPEVPLTAFG